MQKLSSTGVRSLGITAWSRVFVNKVKWIKRSSYGQAGFPLLQRRVLLHPPALAPVARGKGVPPNHPVIILPSRGTIFSRATTTVASRDRFSSHEAQTALTSHGNG